MDISLKKILHFLANPFVLSLVPAMIILAIINPDYQKYVLELVQHRKFIDNTYVFYEDITGDGFSERIELREHSYSTNFIVYSHTGRVFDDWRLTGSFDLILKSNIFYAGDYNADGKKEMFFFTVSRDSIFLHALFDLDSPTLTIKDRLITRVGYNSETADASLLQVEMEDLDGDGKKELVFCLSAGYSLSPRAIFAYYIEQDSLIRSPESFAMISRFICADITGDGRPEIICSNNAPSNVPQESAIIHDRSNWIMVLDHTLSFLFEPMEIPSRFDVLYAFPGMEEDPGRSVTAIRMRSFSDDPAIAYSFSNTGVLAAQTVVDVSGRNAIYFKDTKGNPGWVFTNKNYDLEVYDANFNLQRMYPAMGFQYYKLADLDHCGETEILAYEPSSAKLTVFRDGFELPISFSPASSDYDQILSVVHRDDDSSLIFYQVGQDHYLLRYRKNSIYLMRFVFSLLLYFGFVFFTWLVQRIQKRQLQRAWDTKKKITELQLSLVKNQLDPHFSLNALNAIVDAARSGKIDKIEKGLMHFAGMYRNMLLTAGQLRQSLSDELLFTKNYLELEVLRFEDAIRYNIAVGDEVDANMLVPKMLIQVHAENSVKHGLSNKASDGLVEIDVRMDKQVILIKITDNGIGRQAAIEQMKNARHDLTSTGKGLALMKDFYELYLRYYNQRITSEITDLCDKNGNPSGTSVLISIHLQDDTSIRKPLRKKP